MRSPCDGIWHSFLGRRPSRRDKWPCSLGGGHRRVGSGRHQLAEDPFVLPNDPLLVGDGPRVPDRRTLIASPRRLRVRRTPLPARKGPLLVDRDPVLALRGPLVVLSVRRQSVRGPLLTGDDPLRAREGSPGGVRDPRPADSGLHQEAEDPVSSTKGLREEPKGIHRKPDDVSSLAEDLCLYPRVLVQETAFHPRWNKGQWVISKSGASRSEGLSHVSTPLRPESEGLLVVPEQLCRQGAARSAMNLAPPTTGNTFNVATYSP